MSQLYQSYSQKMPNNALSFDEMPLPSKVVMLRPDFFEVGHAINPHMKDSEGSFNQVDKQKALGQWDHLRQIYRELGFEPVIFNPLSACPDMVFCANQSLPYLSDKGEKRAILSRMASPIRRPEVESIAADLQNQDYQTELLPIIDQDIFFEGTGDALWVPGRRLLCGGYGFRTHESVYEDVSRLTNTSIVLFELKNPRFYHLDTCLSIINDRIVLACREAFTESDWEMLQRLFSDVIPVNLSEADSPGFSCNAHSPDGQHVIIQKGNRHTITALEQRGLQAIECDTSEFVKSGGSVFCMKLMLF